MVRQAGDRDLLRALFRITNLHGALVTMPHKATTARLVDELTTTKTAGASNVVPRRADGSLLGDRFDGAGFVRGTQRKRQGVADTCGSGTSTPDEPRAVARLRC